MLVLARQREQSIMIGDDIEVRVVDLRADKVRLGINAPKHVAVHRREVYEAIRRENESAAEVQPARVIRQLVDEIGRQVMPECRLDAPALLVGHGIAEQQDGDTGDNQGDGGVRHRQP